MPFLTQSGIQNPEDASLSDRLALWMAEQQQQCYPSRQTRPRFGMLAPMAYARDGGWPVYAGDAPTLPLIEGFDPFHLLSDERAFGLLFGLLWPLMRELDGLILTGGGDLYSCLYGQTPHPQAETPDVWRDVWERYVALMAWLLCIPTLGICRGMQLMNVVLGGTLYQDLQAQWPKERSALLRHSARGGALPPPAVLAELARPVINHRGPEFAAILRRVTARLQYVFQTTSSVLIFPASGTGGQVCVLVNLFSPGEHVVAITIGHFGNRFAQIAEHFGLQVSHIAFPWGDAADPAIVEVRLHELAPYRGVLLTHNETSTGVTNDLQTLAALIRQLNPDILIVVDAVSSLGCIAHQD